jgi:hypothetical protein
VVAQGCDQLRGAIQEAKADRNRALAENAQAENDGRVRPHSGQDIARLRAEVERASGAARNAGCDINDLVGLQVGLQKEPPDVEMRTDRCRDIRLVFGPTAATIIDAATAPGHILRAMRAVQSRAPHGMMFIAGELVDVSSTTGERGMFGLWAADSIETPAIVVAVSPVARTYTSLADASAAGLDLADSDDGAHEALECSRRVKIT